MNVQENPHKRHDLAASMRGGPLGMDGEADSATVTLEQGHTVSSRLSAIQRVVVEPASSNKPSESLPSVKDKD
jgi:hypothetical protein